MSLRSTGSRFRLPLAVLIAAGACVCGAARAEKGAADGVYRDRDGKQHTWAVQRSHLLLWNDQPYAPAGVVFRSEHLKSPSAENLQKDGAELDRLRSAGVQDLWIEPGRGLLENTPEQIQAVIDAVESRGFRYGLRVGDRSREPLIGFSPTLAPTRVPAVMLQPGVRAQWEIATPRARRAVYALVDCAGANPNDDRVQNWAIAAGQALVEGEKAAVQVPLPRTRLLGKTRGLLLVAPEIQVEPEELGSFGDLWAGMEAYSARLKKHLQAVKFGPGLRFVLDPFTAGDGSIGREDMVFPSSEVFRTAFREWLSRRVGIQTLNTQWRTTDRRIPGMEEACRLIPMWARNDPPEGDGWLVDPVDRVAYRCVPRQSTVWKDLDDFRSETLKRWMNNLAFALKQEGLNVPVLFSWSAYHPVFINSPSPSGYDGLGAQLSGTPEGMARESAAYALAQAEEADRNSWLIATRFTGPRDEQGKLAPLDTTARARQAWDAARDAGFRGVFLDPEQEPNAAAIAKELSTALAADARLKETPKVCFFPMALATSDRVTKLSTGTWWLPSGAPAKLTRYGDAVVAYEMERPLGDPGPVEKGTVIWSVTGKQDFTFFADLFAQAAWFDTAGQPLKIKANKRGQIKVPLSGEPIIVTGADVMALFPIELTVAQLDEIETLLNLAQAQKLDIAAMRTLYDDARKSLLPQNAAVIHTTMTPLLARLRDAVTPYLWLEGERSSSHNFSRVTFQAGCSAGTYLALDRPEASTAGPYRARFNLEIRRDAAYEIWVAGRVPGRPGVSPLVWQVNDEPAVEVAKPPTAGEDYARGMGWFSLGRVTLKAGRHELTIVVPDKAEGGRFVAGIDAIVLSREPFTPKGIEKPYTRARASR